MNEKKRVVIIGAGPAGLTAAYELSKHGSPSLILESDYQVGGISKTVEYQGFRFDVGGHRFFSKSAEIEALWTEILGPEIRECSRLSRIFYRNRFFFYPLKPFNALANIGIIEATACVASYLCRQVFPIKEEKTFEDWVSNRFGPRLYEMFFKTYTEKVWGIPCTEIGADWAAQRIHGLNLFKAVWNALFQGRRDAGTVKTLIDHFRYPRLGPGQMWEACRDKVLEGGSEVLYGRNVTGVRVENQKVVSVQAVDSQGNEEEYPCDFCISSMPLRELFAGMDPAPPEDVLRSAGSLRYRDFLVVALIIEKADVFPDNWIYIHSPEVQVCRIQNFKSWSVDLVPEQSKTCLGLEYFVWENDDLWRMDDEALIAFATVELMKLQLVGPGEVVDGSVVRVKKAYPIYDLDYQEHLKVIRTHLDPIENIYCVGRNGQHRYNNQDHSMATALLAARRIVSGTGADPWNVNIDAEYHEIMSSERTSPSYPNVRSLD